MNPPCGILVYCFTVKTMNKQLQPMLRIGRPEVPTYTEIAIEEKSEYGEVILI